MFGSFFRTATPAAFSPPDPFAAVQIEEPEAGPTPSTCRVQLSQTDQIAADQYLKSKPIAAEHEKAADKAKKALLASQGTASHGTLPDGRIVSKHVVPVAAEAAPRAATTRTSITIQ